MQEYLIGLQRALMREVDVEEPIVRNTIAFESDMSVEHGMATELV